MKLRTVNSTQRRAAGKANYSSKLAVHNK